MSLYDAYFGGFLIVFTWILLEISNFSEHYTHSAPQEIALAGHRDDRKSSPEQSLKVSIMPLSRKNPLSSGETRVLGFEASREKYITLHTHKPVYCISPMCRQH